MSRTLRGALIALTMAGGAQAATLVTDGGGNVLGATDVNVDGVLYDVSFVDGRCSDIFSGCDAASDFTFTTQADALSAAGALNSAVFPGSSPFRDDPQLINGCGNLDDCNIWTPFGVAGSSLSFSQATITDTLTTPTWFVNTVVNVDYAENPDTVTWAQWSAAATVVPLPAPVLMLLGGLAGLGLMQRRKG